MGEKVRRGRAEKGCIHLPPLGEAFSKKKPGRCMPETFWWPSSRPSFLSTSQSRSAFPPCQEKHLMLKRTGNRRCSFGAWPTRYTVLRLVRTLELSDLQYKNLVTVSITLAGRACIGRWRRRTTAGMVLWDFGGLFEILFCIYFSIYKNSPTGPFGGDRRQCCTPIVAPQSKMCAPMKYQRHSCILFSRDVSEQKMKP